MNIVQAAADLIWSPVLRKFPDLKIALSEGGIGWVPALLDRLDHMQSYSSMYGTWDGITDVTPADVLRRNFWFCALEDPSAFRIRDVIGQLLYGTVFTNYFAGHRKAPECQAREIIDVVFRGILTDSERGRYATGEEIEDTAVDRASGAS